MSHHIYTTEGFVMGSSGTKEADKYIRIFTRDLGLVGAHAQGIRLGASKLRYGLQDLSYAKVSLVRGKNMWRVTNALPQKNLFLQFRNEKNKLELCASIIALLGKLLAGEEKNEELFETLSLATSILEKENLSREEIKNIECIALLRIIHALGYSANSQKLGKFIENNDWSPSVISDMTEYREEAIKEINNAIKASQL